MYYKTFKNRIVSGFFDFEIKEFEFRWFAEVEHCFAGKGFFSLSFHCDLQSIAGFGCGMIGDAFGGCVCS